MIDRLSSRIGANPRRAAWVLLSLLTVLTLVLMVVLVQAVGFENPFKPPYSSEDTPLSFTDLCVVWTTDLAITVASGGLEYSNISFLWGHETESGFVAIGGILANETEQEALSSGSTAVVEVPCGGGGVDGQMASFSMIIRDILGDGEFDPGDSITYKMNTSSSVLPLPEDTEYTFALMYHGRGFGVPLGEYGCAIHDGEFYSWESHILKWSTAWWDW